ncbi:MAG: 4Fe-4S binding protein, partial [Anaerolineae bacterium]|nr:4Fe-4S binding protein [Anaerolineae bacterium]
HCIGCTRCAQVCPRGCITGEPKDVHSIDAVDCCIACGACMQVCPADAIRVA